MPALELVEPTSQEAGWEREMHFILSEEVVRVRKVELDRSADDDGSDSAAEMMRQVRANVLLDSTSFSYYLRRVGELITTLQMLPDGTPSVSTLEEAQRLWALAQETLAQIEREDSQSKGPPLGGS